MKASLPFKYIIAEKKGKNYVVFDFKDDSGKRKRKWVTTDLPVDCSYKALTAKVNVIVAKFYEEFLTAHKAVIFPVKVFTEELRVVFFKVFAFY